MKLKIQKATATIVTGATVLLASEFFDSQKEAKKELLLRMKRGECFVAMQNNVLVGIYMYSRAFTHFANYLEYIVVSKQYRGKGVARKLLEHYVKISKKETPKKQLFALSSTHKGNTVSATMHKACGFKVLGTVKKLHYGKDELIFGHLLR